MTTLQATIRGRISNEPDKDESGSNVERLLAGIALIAVAQRLSVGPGLMPRHVVILLLLPLWVRLAVRYRGARLLLILGTAAVAAGAILAQLARSTHTVSPTQTLNTCLVVAGVVGGVGVVLWSRSVLPLRQVGMWFGAGMLISAAINGGTLSITNPLKFGWSIPIAVFVLSAFNVANQRGRELLALLLLATLAILSDARAMFGVCLLAAVLLGWQMRPSVKSRVRSWVWTAGMIGALGYAIYNVGTTLLVDGYLGVEAQQRSVQQLGAAGSLILGGRPELAATAALFLVRPWGFGAGVTISHGELLTAKAGMASINYQPDNGYVENYMFGSDSIEVHSNLGDLWANFGFAGIALMLWMALLVVRNVATDISHRQASAVTLFLSCWSLWNIAFSPFYSSAVIWIITLGLLLPMRGQTSGRTESGLKSDTGGAASEHSENQNRRARRARSGLERARRAAGPTAGELAEQGRERRARTFGHSTRPRISPHRGSPRADSTAGATGLIQ